MRIISMVEYKVFFSFLFTGTNDAAPKWEDRLT
jgi:hypothetical protein